MHPWDIGDDFVIYKCVAAAHTLRVGAAPPRLRTLPVAPTTPERAGKSRALAESRPCRLPSCGKVFLPTRSSVKFCSVRCSQRAARAGRAAIARSKLPRSSSIRDTVRLSPEERARAKAAGKFIPPKKAGEWDWLRANAKEVKA
jgi:hypothetical protein